MALALMCIGLLCALGVQARPKVDVIHLKNGDRITCEILRMERGQLHVKPPYALSSIVIDWNEVEWIESPQGFVLEDRTGEFISGTFPSPEESDAGDEDTIVLSHEGLSQEWDKDDVVGMHQLGESFLRRIKGRVDYGFTFTRANNQTQSTLQGSADYIDRVRTFGGSVSSLFSGQTLGINTNRHHAQVYYQRFYSQGWNAGAFSEALTSDQQRLKLRTTLGGGVGRQFIRTNRNRFWGLAGVVWTSERFDSDAGPLPLRNNAEGALMIEYSNFRFDSTEFNSQMWVYPSFTSLGRFRVTLDSSFYWDIIGDLYARISYFHNFDSRPPANTPKHDFGTSTSVGWKF